MLRLKELRTKHGMSQIEFAKKFNVAQNTVSNWENGNRQIDSETAIKLADFFDVSTDYLLSRTDNPEQSVDQQLEGIEFALYGEIKELTEDEKQDILDFVKFTKSKRKDNADWLPHQQNYSR